MNTAKTMSKNVKHYIAILLWIWMVGFVSGQQKGDSFAQAKQTGAGNLVYVHANVNGFASNGASGDPEGLLIDVMKGFEDYVSTTHGIDLDISYVSAKDNDFKLFLKEVQSSEGGVFGLSNTSIREERKAILQFSPAFLNNISVLVSNASFPTLSSLDQISEAFADKTGYGVESTTNYGRMMKVKQELFPSMVIRSVNSSKEIIQNAIQDTNGFGFVDIHYYLEALNDGKPIKRHAVGDNPGDKFGIIMPLDSDWEPVLKAYLESGVFKTPEYREAVIKHLGKGALRML